MARWPFDYGNAFHQFQHRYLGELTPRSVLLVTGDARTNYHDPNIVAFAEAASLARAVYWAEPGGTALLGYGGLGDGRLLPVLRRRFRGA